MIIVWTPKYRYRVLFGEVKSLVENDIKMLFDRKSVEVIELNVRIDHVHAVVSIPPKISGINSVSTLMGALKGKLAIKLFKSYPKLKQRPYWGNHFWSRGYLVTTVGVDEEIIRRYAKYQEKEDKKEDKKEESQDQSFDLLSLPPES